MDEPICIRMNLPICHLLHFVINYWRFFCMSTGITPLGGLKGVVWMTRCLNVEGETIWKGKKGDQFHRVHHLKKKIKIKIRLHLTNSSFSVHMGVVVCLISSNWWMNSLLHLQHSAYFTLYYNWLVYYMEQPCEDFAKLLRSVHQ